MVSAAVRLGVRLEAVRGGERFGACVLLARVRSFASVRSVVRFQMMGRSECLAASALFASAIVNQRKREREWC